MSKKRLWCRLTAALLTLSFVFSLLAMPASAATTTTWIRGVATTNMDGNCYEWWTEDYLRDFIIGYWYSTHEDTLTEDQLDELVIELKSEYEASDAICEEQVIPSGSYLGYSEFSNSTIYWYSNAALTPAVTAGALYYSVDWDTGILTLTNGFQEFTCTPIDYTAPTPDTGSTVSGGSSDSTGMILLAGGAAVAAASAFYLYTHPDVIQNVKQHIQDFFQGIADKFQPAATAEDTSAQPAPAQ